MSTTQDRIDTINENLAPFMSAFEIEDSPTNRIVMLDAIYQCLVLGNVMVNNDRSLLAVAVSIESCNLKAGHDIHDNPK